MNDDLRGRLESFKFEKAEKYLEGEPEKVQELVKALSQTFEDPGWFAGNMAVIIENALENIGTY